MITPLGELTLGDTIPGAAAVAVAGSAGINAALPNLQAHLEALLAFSPAPVSFIAQVELGLQIVANAQASITLGLPVPSIAAQLAAVAALIAELTATAASISAQLGVVVDFQALLSAAGIFAYAYDGDVADLGDELDAEIGAGVGGGAGTDHCNALVLLTSTGPTWTAMGDIFKVTP
jgi:hypothetical protein